MASKQPAVIGCLLDPFRLLPWGVLHKICRDYNAVVFPYLGIAVCYEGTLAGPTHPEQPSFAAVTRFKMRLHYCPQMVRTPTQ